MIVEIDKELEDIFPRYLQSRREDVKRFRAALAIQDFESLRNLAHKIVGNASSYGLLPLGEIARRLENYARDSELESCEREVQALEAYISAIEPKFV